MVDVVISKMYLRQLMERLDQFMTPEQRQMHCLIFGSQVVGSYATREEAEREQKTTWQYVNTVLYVPPHEHRVPINGVSPQAA